MAARHLILVAAALCALVLAACGEKEDIDELGREEPAREGLAIEMGGLTYNVFITRQLNPQIHPDKDYYQGEEPPPEKTLYGVFLQVCNHGERPRPAADEFKVVDTLGNEFFPRTLPEENVFAYHGGEVEAKNCLPEKNSAASDGPIAGSMLLFEFPLETVENRPLELEVRQPFGSGGERETIKFELDI
jgi:hypothetical protein